MLVVNDDLDTARIIRRLQPGGTYVYHTGMLAIDRQRKTPLGQRANVAGLAAYKAYQLGQATLVQRKIGPMLYEYIVVGK